MLNIYGVFQGMAAHPYLHVGVFTVHQYCSGNEQGEGGEGFVWLYFWQCTLGDVAKDTEGKPGFISFEGIFSAVCLHGPEWCLKTILIMFFIVIIYVGEYPTFGDI